MKNIKAMNRRLFIGSALAAGTGLSLPGGVSLAQAEEKDDDVSPLEDLMREHGALNRILLIYEDCQRRIRTKSNFKPKLLNQSATIIRNFIETYHEKLEENYLFPRLEKAGQLVDLCKTLKSQHQAGRKVTSEIISLAKDHAKDETLAKMDSLISMFLRMYRPHEAFEDTVVFPAFKKLLPEKEYDRLGDMFEEQEHKLLGKEGFEGVLEHIAEIEKTLGIHDLHQFTPQI